MVLWPWTKRGERERKEPTTTLYDLSLDFGSLVDEGDNPEARVVMFKRRGEPGEKVGDLLSDWEISKMLDEEEKGDRQSMTTTLTKKSEVVAEVRRRADELRKEKPELTPTQARVEIWYENPDLKLAYQQAEAESTAAIVAAANGETAPSPGAARFSPTAKGADVIGEADRLARELFPRKAAKSLPAARADVWKIRPDLKERYQEARRS